MLVDLPNADSRIAMCRQTMPRVLPAPAPYRAICIAGAVASPLPKDQPVRKLKERYGASGGTLGSLAGLELASTLVAVCPDVRTEPSELRATQRPANRLSAPSRVWTPVRAAASGMTKLPGNHHAVK